MKKYLILLAVVILLVQSCESQKKINQEIMIPKVDSQLEKFDIENFNKESVRGKRTEITELFYIEEDTQSFGYAQQLYASESYFSILKLYYKNGSIKEKGLIFNNGSEIGSWFTFDESGKLVEQKNTDEGYGFGFKQIVKYCKKNKIVLPKGQTTSGFQTSVYKEKDDNGAAVWVITHQTAGDKLERITLGGDTGKELEKTDLEFINH